MKDIYNLELHETLTIDAVNETSPITIVMRVPNGWNYLYVFLDGNITSTFVPLSNEFKPTSGNYPIG